MKRFLLLVLSLCVLTACRRQAEPSKDSSSDSRQVATSSEKSRSKVSKKSQDQSSNQKDNIKNQENEEGESNSNETSQSSSQDITKDVETTVATSAGGPVMPAGGFRYVTGKYGDSILIVNKKNPLPADYAPGENPTAQAALFELIGTMQGLGYGISNSYSGFRSYDYQASLYHSYVARDGQAAADRYSARPGYSEHQTGLAFDLLDSYGQLLEEPQAVAWLSAHAHEYGFVVRYLPGKEAVTGYMSETWHLRYIGQEAADIYYSGLTLEEYFGVPGGSYE